MLGFFAASGLIGALAIGWPLYLHLRKRNKQIQTIPSLKIFGFSRKQTKRIRLQQILLLVSRILILLFLSLLISQPFFKSTASLPLPGDGTELKVLAIVVDDSLYSMVRTSKGSRLEIAKRALISQVEKCSGNVLFSICSSTSPFPSRLMNRAEAIEQVSKMRSIPMEGNIEEALRNCQTELAAFRLAILTASPRLMRLWNDLAIEKTKQKRQLFFVDIPVDSSQPYIESVETNASSLQLRFGGKTSLLDKANLLVESQNEKEQISISAEQAYEEELQIDAAPGPYSILSLLGKKGDWTTYYHENNVGSTAISSAVIFRDPENDDELFVDQALSAVLLSFYPDIKIVHTSSSQYTILPDASVIIFAGKSEIRADSADWLDKQLTRGTTVLYFPCESAINKTRWVDPVEQSSADFPLQLKSELKGIDEILLAELMKLQFKRYFKISQSGKAFLALPNGEAVLLYEEMYPSKKWTFSFALTADLNSPIWQPSFPLLLESIIGKESGTASSKKLFVGDSVSLSEVFGLENPVGTLVYPDGKEDLIERDKFVSLQEAGIYRLTVKGQSTYRAVNIRRPSSSRRFAFRELEARSSYIPIVLKAGSRIPDSRFIKSAVVETTKEKRYDLSGIMVIFLLVFMLSESVVLFLNWNQRGTVSA
ncbi:MAG: BatA domain-containing protein [Lentisphaeria bacterium]|nr:BatA domain-containing protein [Lentisphaeria bacterium]NQZ67254.1 BatA domain-containing protein [Lentisphaeria bacterium]